MDVEGKDRESFKREGEACKRKEGKGKTEKEGKQEVQRGKDLLKEEPMK